MYFVKFLQAGEQQAGGDEVEYRLACSGEFFNRKVETYDWRKSDATRILLLKPFTLLVASQPFDSYPQELCVRFALNRVTEGGTGETGNRILSFLPDEDVVEDVCAVLTLLSRRLISCVVKTTLRPGGSFPMHTGYESGVPLPLSTASKSWHGRGAP